MKEQVEQSSSMLWSPLLFSIFFSDLDNEMQSCH